VILAILGAVAVAIVTFVALAAVLWFLRQKKVLPPGTEDAASAAVVSSHGSGG
jgi:uncharacterized membrane protein YdfJ with MMPL/SSD domain